MIIVYTYVVCDIIQKGHLAHLQGAKALGDILVVGVLTDEATMERKPKPTLSFNERFDIVKNLRMVDVAVPQRTYMPDENILKIKPDIIAESDDHKPPILQATQEAATAVNARIVIMPRGPFGDFGSSTNIKRRIKDGV